MVEWKPPEDELTDTITFLDDFKARVTRLRACFPGVAELHRIHNTMEIEVIIADGIRVIMTDEQITQRLTRMSALQIKIWDDWISRIRELPSGTVVRPGWLDTDGLVRVERPIHQKNMIDSLLDRE